MLATPIIIPAYLKHKNFLVAEHSDMVFSRTVPRLMSIPWCNVQVIDHVATVLESTKGLTDHQHTYRRRWVSAVQKSYPNHHGCWDHCSWKNYVCWLNSSTYVFVLRFFPVWNSFKSERHWESGLAQENASDLPTPCIIFLTIVAGTKALLISLSAHNPEKKAVKKITM